MLNKIVKYSLENRLLVLIASLALIIGGVFTAQNMDIDVFPDLTAPTVAIMTEAHGIATEDVERLVTFPIETTVNGAANIRRVRSVTQAGISIVWVDFDWGMDIYRARQIVSEKLTTINEKLPDGVSEPILAPQSSIMGEIMLISVSSDSMSMMDLRTLADWQIKQRILAVNGVSQVIVMGGDYKQYQAMLDPDKMRYFDITLDDVLEACDHMNRNASGGIINEYSQEYVVRGLTRTTDPNSLGQTVIKTINDIPITLDQIATVKIGYAEPKIGEAFLDGKKSIIITVLKQSHINTLKLTNKIDDALSEISHNLPSHIQVNSHIFRQSDFINVAVNNVKTALFEGGIFVAIILFLFLMNYRVTFISLIAIPLSLIVAVITLKILGLTVNTMSLGGMAIAIGDLVDDAIIDVENSWKRLRKNHRLPLSKRRNTLDVNYDASIEIRSSIIHATFIIIVAFMPLFFLTGMEGRMLRPLGIAFIISLFASLLVALTLTPVLCSYLLTSDKVLNRSEARENRFVSAMNRGYTKLLEIALKHKRVVIAITIILLLSAGVLFTGLGRNFLPEFNEGTLTINTQTMPGISLEKSSQINHQVEAALMDLPEIKHITRRTGRAEGSEHMHGGSYASEIDIPFELKNRSQEEFLVELRERLAHISGINISVGQPLSHRIDHMLSGTNANIAIKLFGNDLSEMYLLANNIKSKIENIPGLVDLRVEPQVEIPQIQIRPNRKMLAKYGIPLKHFNEFIDVAIAGEKVTDVYEGNKVFDFIIRFKPDERNSLESLRQTLIDSPIYGKIPLSYVSNISSGAGPNTINRENVQRKLVVSGNIAGRDLHSVVEDIKSTIDADVKIHENYWIEYGGQFESEARSSRTILVTSIFAIMIIFLMLYQEFKTLKTTAIVMLNLPLALIGGIFSIRLTSGILSIPAMIGFITLFGIASRNGILLVSRYQTLRSSGMSLNDTIITGSSERLNPILMTALTAIFALIPLAIRGHAPGNEIQSPMAIVILGGLLTSTLLNLFVVPVFYSISHKTEAI